MFTDLLKDMPFTLVEARRLVSVVPYGSRQHVRARLWLAWLAHTRFCQLYGVERFTDACPERTTMAGFLAEFPHWDCCSNHSQLRDARNKLIARAERLNEVTPHCSHELLSAKWWLQQSASFRDYDPLRRVVEQDVGLID